MSISSKYLLPVAYNSRETDTCIQQYSKRYFRCFVLSVRRVISFLYLNINHMLFDEILSGKNNPLDRSLCPVAQLTTFRRFIDQSDQQQYYTPLTKLLARQARPGTTHDGSGAKAETYSSISPSIKTKDILIESSKLLCFSLVLFYSKSSLLKTFPAVISRVFIFIINGPKQKALDVKWSQL